MKYFGIFYLARDRPFSHILLMCIHCVAKTSNYHVCGLNGTNLTVLTHNNIISTVDFYRKWCCFLTVFSG